MSYEYWKNFRWFWFVQLPLHRWDICYHVVDPRENSTNFNRQLTVMIRPCCCSSTHRTSLAIIAISYRSSCFPCSMLLIAALCTGLWQKWNTLLRHLLRRSYPRTVCCYLCLGPILYTISGALARCCFLWSLSRRLLLYSADVLKFLHFTTRRIT